MVGNVLTVSTVPIFNMPEGVSLSKILVLAPQHLAKFY